MPVHRKEQKPLRQKRRDKASSPESDADSETSVVPAPGGGFTEEQLKLRAMIPALTPAHGPESTSSAILGSLSLGYQKPNSHTRKKSDGHVNRPPNAFIVFRRAQVQHMPANVTQHQQRISNLTAMFWRVLTAFEQKSWYDLADDIKKLHSILFPEYNFNPRNADGSKKPVVPHAGLTPERLEFAWNEAQLLITKHTASVDYQVDGPAPSGKLARPKAPRKGQGTRAKERRQLEAAQRAAALDLAMKDSPNAFVATIPPFQSAQFEDNQYYPSTDEDPISGSSVEGEAVQWNQDFALDASVSSRSSPSNTWSESVGPLDNAFSEGHFDPVPYVAEEQAAPEVQVATTDYLGLHFNPVDPFPITGHIQEDGAFDPTVAFPPIQGYVEPAVGANNSFVSAAPQALMKHDMTFAMPMHFTTTAAPGQLLTTYYNGVAPIHAEPAVNYDYNGLDLNAPFLETTFQTADVAYGW